MSEIKDFKDLIIWQKGMLIAEKCYQLTKSFPKEELYGMVQQVRRASVSIPANIAEGYGRRTKGDYARFLNISQGSINELQTHQIRQKGKGKRQKLLLALLPLDSCLLTCFMSKGRTLRTKKY
ncbi:MAG: four helix bundle protein [Prochloraceae cyanobacterium]|nr:four helix bundle protein [Prochloraceae cyanobacterium]